MNLAPEGTACRLEAEIRWEQIFAESEVVLDQLADEELGTPFRDRLSKRGRAWSHGLKRLPGILA